MRREYRIMSINEWRESSAYLYQQWFQDRGNDIKKFFKESASYAELEFDDYEYDSTLVLGPQTAFLYFHERDYEYRAEFTVDSDTVQNDIIDKFEILLYAFRMDGEGLGSVKTDLTVKEFDADTLITLVAEMNEKIDKGDLSIALPTQDDTATGAAAAQIADDENPAQP